MTERRTARRFEIAVPIMGWGSEEKYFDGWTRDVSTSGVYLVANRASTNGIYLAASHSVKQNESFLFLMKFPGDFPQENESLLWAYCRAVRVEPECVHGGACVGIAAVVEQYTLPPRMPAALPDGISVATPAAMPATRRHAA
jgi:hypothetical protein